MRYRIIIVFVLIIAAILRLWQLGLNPPSLDWDEASLGYNAYSLLLTGKDEYGNALPLSIRSFGDYKPGLYTYLTILPVSVWGLTEYSTRLVSSLAGIFTVGVLYLLVYELFPSSRRTALMSAFFLSVSPWHIQFSRVAFESNVSQLFIVFGIWMFLKARKHHPFLILSAMSFGLSCYAYHAPRLVIFALLGLFGGIYRKSLRSHAGWVLGFGVILVCMIVPILLEMHASGSRFSSVSVLTGEKLENSISQIESDNRKDIPWGTLIHNRRIVWASEILGGYLDHFNLDFLFLTGDPPGRHHAAGMGMLYGIDFLFVILGLWVLIRSRNTSSQIVLAWFVTAPLASALTTGTPHAVRALGLACVFPVIVSLGMLRIWSAVKSVRFPAILGMVSGVMTILIVLNMAYYLNTYYLHTPREWSSWWQYGYREAVAIASVREPYVDRVITTYRYDQPYIFYLFYQQINPAWYQAQWQGGEIKRDQRNFGKYEFRNIDWEKDQHLTRTLFIGTPGEIPDTASGMIGEIRFLDGSVAFRIVER